MGGGVRLIYDFIPVIWSRECVKVKVKGGWVAVAVGCRSLISTVQLTYDTLWTRFLG